MISRTPSNIRANQDVLAIKSRAIANDMVSGM